MGLCDMGFFVRGEMIWEKFRPMLKALSRRLHDGR